MKMTKEEFRKRMNSQQWMQGKSTEEIILGACIILQIELHEADGNTILDMPAYQFDMLCEEIGKRYKTMGGKTASNGTKGVFGG